MKQLTIKDVLAIVHTLMKEGMSTEEIHKLPIYIGCDDELNGIHTAWYGQMIDSNKEDDAYFVELINGDFCNIKLNGKAILIS
jgi:type 1 glutamine amidotransferase